LFYQRNALISSKEKYKQFGIEELTEFGLKLIQERMLEHKASYVLTIRTPKKYPLLGNMKS